MSDIMKTVEELMLYGRIEEETEEGEEEGTTPIKEKS